MTIKRQFKQLQNMTKPNKGFKKDLHSKLSEQLPGKRISFGFKYAAVGTIALVLLLGGTSVYAYESPEVSEGHFLHPVKEGIEQLEGKLRQGEPEERAGYHLKMFGRRLDEVDHQEMEDHRQALLETAADELGMTVDELEDAMFDPEAREDIMEQLNVESTRFFEMAETHRPNGPPPFVEGQQGFEAGFKGGEDLTWDERVDQVRNRVHDHQERHGEKPPMIEAEIE
jgi:hypothetical protein